MCQGEKRERERIGVFKVYEWWLFGGRGMGGGDGLSSLEDAE